MHNECHVAIVGVLESDHTEANEAKVETEKKRAFVTILSHRSMERDSTLHNLWSAHSERGWIGLPMVTAWWNSIMFDTQLPNDDSYDAADTMLVDVFVDCRHSSVTLVNWVKGPRDNKQQSRKFPLN